ncbi:MAG: DUF4123 domain-containing protein [Litoreibacter sp.]|uniref:DUF4123 domain-containing protein n=1 Tax=Litoreibacter sp. TaxID=1969459 RepID=UPI003298F3DA
MIAGPSNTTLRKRHLSIETIEGVKPLDAQFGIADPKTVPDVLYRPLFGQPESTDADLEQIGGDPKKVLSLHTYAILDAAKITGLPELLAASRLEHRCLFKGDAYDELKDVAPWIVRLKDGDGFTRYLFTHSNAEWHLWDKEPGIYRRSRGTLDDMWGHFRKFTKVKDEDGKWYYFRFWECRPAIEYFTHVAVDAPKSQLWFPHHFEYMAAIIILPRSKTASVFHSGIGDAEHSSKARYYLSRYEQQILSKQREIDFRTRLISHLDRVSQSFQLRNDLQKVKYTKSLILTARRYEIRIEQAVADFAAAAVLLGGPVETDPECLAVLQSKKFGQVKKSQQAS